MKDTNLADLHFDKLLRLQDRVKQEDLDWEGMFPYFLANIPYDEVIQLGSSKVYEKRVKEYDFDKQEVVGATKLLYKDCLDPYIARLDSVTYRKGVSLFFFGSNSSGKSYSSIYILARAIELGFY